MRQRYNYTMVWHAKSGTLVRVKDGKVITGQQALVQAFRDAGKRK